MLIYKKRWIFTWLCCCILHSQVWATSVAPDQFIRQITDSVLNRLQQLKAQQASADGQTQLKIDSKQALTIVEEELKPHIDAKGVAKLVSGRVLWQSLGPEQRARFTAQLLGMVLKTYSTALSQYRDETIQVFPVRDMSPKVSRVEVKSFIVRKLHANIPVNYRIRRLRGAWKVYDVVVEGVSLLQSFRTQIQELLADHSFDEVLQIMQKPSKL